MDCLWSGLWVASQKQLVIVFGEAKSTKQGVRGESRRPTHDDYATRPVNPQYSQEYLEGAEPRVNYKKENSPLTWTVFGADYGARTRHLHLGKVALYQMS